MSASIHMRRLWAATELSDVPDAATGLVRQVTGDDVERLGTLLWRAFGHRGVDGFDDAAAAETEARDTFAGKWGPMVWDASLFALVDGEPAAASIVVLDDAHEMRPLLAFLVTEPARQRRGFGAQLVRATLVRLDSRGIRELHLAVDSNNPARRLYEYLGFIEV